MNPTTKGMDVSKYQGKVDWQKVKKAGVQFAMLRAGFGRFPSQKDECFEENYKNATAAGVPVGAYHYSYAKSAADAKEEARVFLSWLAGKQFSYPVAYDIEEKVQADLGKAVVSDIIRAFCEAVEAAGYYVCIYTNKFFLDNYVDEDCKKRYDVWVAQWAAKNTYEGAYGIWQYSSTGTVDGVDGRVDLDYAYKDYPAIMKANGLNGIKKTGPAAGGSNSGNPFPAKTLISLQNTPLYVSATAKIPAAYKTGSYYIYDGKEISGRYRITSSPERVGKTPIGENVTGYVNKTDLK